MHRREHHNIDVAQVVRDHRPVLGKATHYTNVNFQTLQRSRRKSVQPIRPCLSRRWPLHQQLSPVSNKVANQLNASRQRPEEIHQINLVFQ
jgi:hypothetical protein